MRRFLVFSLWLVLALAGFIAVLGVFATRGSVDLSNLPRIETSPVNYARAQAKLESFQRVSEEARAGGRELPAQISFSHDEVTELFRNWSKKNHWFGSITDLQIAFLQGKGALTGTLRSRKLDFPFRIEFALSTENSRRTVDLTRVQVGELFAPGFARAILLALVDRTVDAGLPRIPMDIETLVVTNGEILASGSAIP